MYVNDSKDANSKMKKIVVDNSPRLCLFATRDICCGKQLRHCYGDSDYPWRKKFCPFMFVVRCWVFVDLFWYVLRYIFYLLNKIRKHTWYNVDCVAAYLNRCICMSGWVLYLQEDHYWNFSMFIIVITKTLVKLRWQFAHVALPCCCNI